MKYGKLFSILALMFAFVSTGVFAQSATTWSMMTWAVMTWTVATGYVSMIEEDFGGRASSIEWNIAPAKIPNIEENTSEEISSQEQNPSDWDDSGLWDSDQSWVDGGGQDDIEAIVEAVVDDTIIECNEEQYILARRAMLQAQSYEVVYIIPDYYAVLLGAETIAEINAQVQMMKQMSPVDRNRMIQSIVCKIEAAKENRNAKYSNIWAPANWNASEYLSQYLQDMMILWYVWN